MQGPRVSVLVAESPLPVRRPPEHRRTGTVVSLRALARGGVAAGRSLVPPRWPAELLPGHKKPSLSQLCTGSDQNIRTTEEPPPQESLVAAMTSQTRKAGEETPPPSPSAAAASPPVEDAPLLPDAGVRRRPACGRFAQRSGSFRREVGRAAAETFLLTRLTLILLRYLGYA